MDTILITGGNGAMAKRLVKHFADQFSFVLLDIHGTASSELASYRVTYFQCNICNLDELDRVQETISARDTKLVAIVNNAAVDFVPARNASYKNEYSSEEALNVLNVNVVGAMNVIEKFKALLIRSKGSVINVSSVYSKVPADQRIYSELIGEDGTQFKKPIYYGLSKAALNYITKFYVNELSSCGVRVNTLIFGGVESNQPDSFKDRYVSKVPLGRMSSWGDVLNAFQFLLSNDSSYVNGIELTIDGGLLCKC